MPPRIPVIRASLRRAVATVMALLWMAAPHQTHGCTIFVLTDENRALFFNNEDWSNPNTRLWFIPAGTNHLGCAYVGFDDGWAQGGLNTAGVAFDWVSGHPTDYEPEASLRTVRGNPSERMLESCKTVDEAIAFYRQHREPEFARARILIADRTGASVVIGARDGNLHVARLHQSRGFGYGHTALERALAKAPVPTIDHGSTILRACLQHGDGGTKYSNAFDLRSGDMVLFPSPDRTNRVTLHLATELAKGPHYYEFADLRTGATAAPRPLLNNMKRFYLDEFPPLADQEPAVTERIRGLLRDSTSGSMRADDYAPEFWSALSSQRDSISAELKALGDLISLTLVGRSKEEGARRGYRYRVEFDRITVLQHFVFNEKNQVESIQSEASESKRDATPRKNRPQ